MNSKLRHFLPLLCFMLLCIPAAALAKPNVAVSIKAEKEITVKENGKEVKKVIEAKEILPGDIITYSLNFANSGDAAASNVILNDPIPEGTAYLFGSATETAGELSFSIDHGKSFKKASMLTYEMSLPGGGKEKRTASPEQYTDIRWIIKTIPPGVQGLVSFKVKVK